MTWLEAIEVADMKPVEAAEPFAQAPKLQNVGRDMETEMAWIVQKLGYLALAITLAASYVAATPQLDVAEQVWHNVNGRSSYARP
jgi:hypothetical protein